MIYELIRDTAFGHVVRFVTRGKALQYAEERDSKLWMQYVDQEKSGHLAHHGTTEPLASSDDEKEKDEDPEKEKEQPDRALGGVRTREGEEARMSDGTAVNHASGVKVDSEKGKDHDVVGWYGDDDPENPMNWTLGKKVFVTFQICLLTFSVYIGSAIYTPGLMDVERVFGVAQVPATLGLTLFVAGYGLGPMLWSPMSEIPQIGRNPIYIGTLLVFVLLQIPTALAVNFGMLLAFRFLTGFIGSPCLATGGASIGDMYHARKRAYPIAIWGVAAVCGPVLGPLVGGFAVEAEGWTWTIWELMWLSGFGFVVLFFFLPETSSQNILYRRARRLRKLTGNHKLISEPELAAADMTPKDIAFMALIRPITLNFTEPIVFALNLYIALVYGLLYIWFESFPIVFVEIYGFTLGLQGVAFLGILVGAFLSIPPFFWYLHKYQEKQFNENNEIKPELRMPIACVGSFFIPVCLFWFGWTSRASVHWIVPIIGSGFFGAGTFLLFQAVLNYLPDAYPDYAASVLAGNDLFRSSFGAGFPLFASAMYRRLGVGWASSLLGFLGIAFIPIPFILYKYGEKIRHKSKHARKDL